eukprot:SAG31_NODE_13701_length_852_cov_1.406375_2_plen_196_part_00
MLWTMPPPHLPPPHLPPPPRLTRVSLLPQAWWSYHARVVLLLRKARRARQSTLLQHCVGEWAAYLADKQRRRVLEQRLTLAVARRALRNCLAAWHEVKERAARWQRLVDKIRGRSPYRRLKEAFDLWLARAGGKHCCSWKELKDNSERRDRVQRDLEAAEHGECLETCSRRRDGSCRSDAPHSGERLQRHKPMLR